MQLCLNSKKEKYIFSPIVMTGLRTLFFSYNLAGKPRNSNKSTKCKRISRHIKLDKQKLKIWPRFLMSIFQIFSILVVTDRELARNSKVISEDVKHFKHGR